MKRPSETCQSLIMCSKSDGQETDKGKTLALTGKKYATTEALSLADVLVLKKELCAGCLEKELCAGCLFENAARASVQDHKPCSDNVDLSSQSGKKSAQLFGQCLSLLRLLALVHAHDLAVGPQRYQSRSVCASFKKQAAPV